MDTYQVLSELCSTILLMQSFLLSVSQDHKKIGCEKEASCKAAEFLDVLDKNLNADKTYDETRCLFVADC